MRGNQYRGNEGMGEGVNGCTHTFFFFADNTFLMDFLKIIFISI